MTKPIKKLIKPFINKLLIFTLVALSLLAFTSPLNQTSATTDTHNQATNEEVSESNNSEIAGTNDQMNTQKKDHTGEEAHASGGHGAIGPTLLTLAILLFAAKIGGAIEKYNVPRVLGELTAGVVLSIIALTFGLDFLTQARNDQIVI